MPWYWCMYDVWSGLLPNYDNYWPTLDGAETVAYICIWEKGRSLEGFLRDNFELILHLPHSLLESFFAVSDFRRLGPSNQWMLGWSGSERQGDDRQTPLTMLEIGEIFQLPPGTSQIIRMMAPEGARWLWKEHKSYHFLFCFTSPTRFAAFCPAAAAAAGVVARLNGRFVLSGGQLLSVM